MLPARDLALVVESVQVLVRVAEGEALPGVVVTREVVGLVPALGVVGTAATPLAAPAAFVFVVLAAAGAGVRGRAARVTVSVGRAAALFGRSVAPGDCG